MVASSVCGCFACILYCRFDPRQLIACRAKFVQLLAAVVKAELRGGSIETNNDEKGEDKEEEQEAAGKGSQDEAQGAEQPGNEPDEATKAEEEQQDEKDGEEAKSD